MSHRFILVFTTYALLVPSAAEAYTLKYSDGGEAVRWHASEIPLRLDASLDEGLGSSDAADIILDALATWESSGFLPAHFSVEHTEGAQMGFVMGEENNNDIIALRNDWPFASNHSAVTITTYDSISGAVIDSDIVFDGTRQWSTNEVPHSDHIDLLDTATHEVGHLLGFEHSDLEEATMYAYGPSGSAERRDLHEDDIDAIIAAYGNPPLLGRTPEAGCSISSRRGPRDGLPMVLIMAAILSLFRRQK